MYLDDFLHIGAVGGWGFHNTNLGVGALCQHRSSDKQHGGRPSLSHVMRVSRKKQNMQEIES